MDLTLSIISLNYNRLKFTQEHIENVINTTDVDFEFILVSNHDCVKSAEVRKYIKNYKTEKNNYLKKIKKILNNKNYGVAGGRNSGLIYSSGEYKVILDDDILMPSNWASKILKLLQVVDRIGVAGYCVEKERVANKYKIQTYNGCVFQTKGRDNIGGACMVIPPATFEKLGYFNEWFPDKFGFEDADYGARIGSIGKINAYIYPERAIQQKDVINSDDYHDWKKRVYDNKRSRQMLASNILRYQKGIGLYIGKERLRKKWSDLH